MYRWTPGIRDQYIKDNTDDPKCRNTNGYFVRLHFNEEKKPANLHLSKSMIDYLPKDRVKDLLKDLVKDGTKKVVFDKIKKFSFIVRSGKENRPRFAVLYGVDDLGNCDGAYIHNEMDSLGLPTESRDIMPAAKIVEFCDVFSEAIMDFDNVEYSFFRHIVGDVRSLFKPSYMPTSYEAEKIARFAIKQKMNESLARIRSEAVEPAA